MSARRCLAMNISMLRDIRLLVYLSISRFNSPHRISVPKLIRQNAESVKMVEESVISIAAIILKASNFALLKNVSNKKG